MPKNIVLCVDDEPIVLRGCTTAVALAGFRAVVAENGVAGLEAFMHLRDEICLVLADVVMPAMSGIDMAESIRRIDPLARILLMSGYSHEAIQCREMERFPFIRKPFVYSVLIDTIRSVLGAETEGAAAGV